MEDGLKEKQRLEKIICKFAANKRKFLTKAEWNVGKMRYRISPKALTNSQTSFVERKITALWNFENASSLFLQAQHFFFGFFLFFSFTLLFFSSSSS